MVWLGTNFRLTLGGMQIRFMLAIEDAPDETAVNSRVVRHTPHHAGRRSPSRPLG